MRLLPSLATLLVPPVQLIIMPINIHVPQMCRTYKCTVDTVKQTTNFECLISNIHVTYEHDAIDTCHVTCVSCHVFVTPGRLLRHAAH